MSINVPIAENWKIHDLSGYLAYHEFTDSNGLGMNPGLPLFPGSLVTQRHIDIRTFDIAGEQWFSSHIAGATITDGYQTSHNNWPGISYAGIGVTPNLTAVSNMASRPLDLSLIPNSIISLALPAFPLNQIDTANSSLTFSSDGFGSHTDTLLFSASTTSLSAGDSNATWPLSALVNTDITKVINVRLIFKVTGTCTIVLMALRLLDPLWVQANMDFDDARGQLRQAIPVNGSTSAVAPTANYLPTLYRAAPSSVDSPRPIDSDFGVIFNTGSQAAQDSFTLLMRTITKPSIQQNQLNLRTQAQLTGRTQPQYGLDDAVPRGISFSLQWGTVEQIQITNYYTPGGYVWTGTAFPTLANNTSYLMICSLVDTTARLWIYNVDQTTFAVGSLLFDTGLISDSFLFVRVAGQVGFQCSLKDGDAFIRSVLPRSIIYAEYISSPLNSLTPVSGAHLFVNETPDAQLWTSWTGPVSSDPTKLPTLTPDPTRSTSGLSTKVMVLDPSASSQGVISNLLSPPGDSVTGIANLDAFQVEFDLWFPLAAFKVGTINVALQSVDGATVSLIVPLITPGQWQHITLKSPSTIMQSGLYSLVITYTGTLQTNFWIDSVSVKERLLNWSARAVADDPWHSNYAPWTDFDENINSYVNGVKFNPRGTQLQLRGRALRADAAIYGSPILLPKYAELGRIVWPEEIALSAGDPTASYLHPNVGRTYTFNGYASSSPNGNIVGWVFSFGDGATALGPKVKHTYAAAGSYTSSLIVTDRLGYTNTTFVVIAVS